MQKMVRAVYRVAKMPNIPAPYDTVVMRVFYPAVYNNAPQENETGVLPVDKGGTPYPVVIFMPGINVGPEAYRWLAVDLVKRGMVVVLYSWITENLPGLISLTPGVDFTYAGPEKYGQGPTSSTLPVILADLKAAQSDGILAGALDLNTVVIGGHSAGGSIALQNANPAFFPQVKGAFSYGAHNAASKMLGFEEYVMLPLCSDLPILIMGGTNDGVIAASRERYIKSQDDHAPIQRTFAESYTGGRDDCHLVMIDGANHFAIAHPVDTTTGRPFLDAEATKPGAQIRTLIGELVGGFIDTHIRRKPSAEKSFEAALHNPLVQTSERK